MLINRFVLFILFWSVLQIPVSFQNYASAQTAEQSFDNDLKRLMSDLTGNTPIKGTRLSDRYSLENKKVSRDYLYDELEALGLKPERHEYKIDGENIYAVLRSTVPSEEYIIIGAHYDSVRDCPGANDNGSGVVFVYGTAKKLIGLENRSKNYIFVFFDDEERGLRGSKSFAQKIQEEKLKINSVHTIDQFGWDSDKDKAIELELPYEGIAEIYREVIEQNGFDVPLHISDVPATDHTSFRRLGYNAIGITEEYKNGDTTPYYHRPSDTYETVDFDYLEFGIDVFVKVLIRIMDK